MSDVRVYGDHDDKTVAQMRRCMDAESAIAGVLCADGHLGYAQPVGGVIAYQDQISISGVGFDIGCGNMAAKTDMPFSEIEPKLASIVDDIGRAISFGIGRKNVERVDRDLFDSGLWQDADVSNLKEMARAQLGTVGSGNHYVDLFEGEDGFVWIGVHFGSRGLGHKTATKYLKLAGGQDGVDVAPALVDPAEELGARYRAGMELAGAYAYAGREWVVERVRKILAATITDSVHNHHNFAWRENHDGRELWVVRKGATPAFPGQRGFVGGSMGDNAVILEGVEGEASAQSLYSTVHGAGRVMSRSEAKGKVHRKTGEVIREPRITRAEMDAWISERNVLVRGGDVDEAPQSYRRLSDVLEHHAGTVRVLHTLRPIAVLMAGSNERDPYKD